MSPNTLMVNSGRYQNAIDIAVIRIGDSRGLKATDRADTPAQMITAVRSSEGTSGQP